MLHTRLFVLTIMFYLKSIWGDELCDRSDTACTTYWGREHYPKFINGIENKVNSSDPLVLDKVDADSDKLKFKLRNAVLTGLKNCNITRIAFHGDEDSTFEYHMQCPYIESNAEYSMSGYIGDMFFEGEGTVKITAEDYIFNFDGTYEIRKRKDGKQYDVIKTYTLNIEPRGKVVFNFENLFGDKEKSDAANKFLNSNWMLPDKELGTYIRAFMDKFMENKRIYLNIVPADNIFSKP